MMVMYIAEICTPWGHDIEGNNIAQVVVDYLYDSQGFCLSGVAFSDVTNNYAGGSPDLLNIEIIASESIISNIEKDSKYLVLWSQEL